MTLLVKYSERQIITKYELIWLQEVDHDALKLCKPILVDIIAPYILILYYVDMILLSIDINEAFTFNLMVKFPLFLLNIGIKFLAYEGNLLGLLGNQNVVIEVIYGIKSCICDLLYFENEWGDLWYRQKMALAVENVD